MFGDRHLEALDQLSRRAFAGGNSPQGEFTQPPDMEIKPPEQEHVFRQALAELMIALSAISFRHQAPSQRMHLTAM